tara:strand:- start:259 stop:651 length:393 start_codon:yes stop_codon:yes gene_type:complete
VVNKMLRYNTKIEVKQSPIHGYGVFAKENISIGEVLEDCHYIKLSNTDVLHEYKFNWPKQDRNDLVGSSLEYYTLPLGNACIYNSSLKDGDNNADWETDTERHIYTFRSIKAIEVGQEIITYYGDAYWSN